MDPRAVILHSVGASQCRGMQGSLIRPSLDFAKGEQHGI